MTSPEIDQHIHRWLLGTPVNGVSSGICKNCGEHKEMNDPLESKRNFTISQYRSKKVEKKELAVLNAPGGRLKNILTGMLQGMKFGEIAVSMKLSIAELLVERNNGLSDMGIPENNPAAVLRAVIYCVGNGHLPTPEIEKVELEDTEIVVLDMLTQQTSDIVSKEMGIAVAHFEKVMVPTYDKLGVNNSLAAAAVWTVMETKKESV